MKIFWFVTAIIVSPLIAVALYWLFLVLVYRGIGSIQGLADALGFSLAVLYPPGVVGALIAALVLIFTRTEGIYRGLVFALAGGLGALFAHWLFAAGGSGPAASVGIFFLIAFAVQYPVFIRIAGVRRD